MTKAGPPTLIPDIVCLTYRPNKGATGGPGGVLYLKKRLLGPRIDDLKLAYHFKDSAQPFGVPSVIKKVINRLGFWPDMREIYEYLPKERRSHLFSATIPEKVRSI